MGLMLAAALIGVALSARQWKAFFEQRAVAATAQSELERAETRRADLAREKARLESRSGREQRAREHNYVRPGEEGPS